MSNQSKELEGPQVEKLAYNTAEACAALGIGRVTLWRLERRKLISSVPHLRTKMYPVEELKRFLGVGVTAKAK